MAMSFTDSRENSPPLSTLTPSSPSPRLRREYRKVLHPLADDSEDGHSPHPSIYEASPVASDDECHSDKDALPESFDSAKQKGVEILESQSPPPSVIDNSASGGISRRNASRFSGLSLLETIAEQKSNSTIRKRDHGSRGGSRGRGSPDEETHLLRDGVEDSEDDFEPIYFYDYASPTQPLYPSLSASVPLFGESPTTFTPSTSSAPNTYFSRNNPPPRQLPSQPTFRPPVSMNRSYGSLSSHPFHRAPILITHSPDASYDPNQRTPDTLESPTSRSRAESFRDAGIWGKIGRGLCLICCCFSVTDADL